MIFRGLARSLWPVQRAGFFSRNLWKVGLGIAAAVLLTSRGATEAPHLPQLNGRVAAATTVPCGPYQGGVPGVYTWSAGTYNLPVNPGNDPFPDVNNPPCVGGVVIGPGQILQINAADGAVDIRSSGAALSVAGGTLQTIGSGASPDHAIKFEAAFDVASWDGIDITASGTSKGNASLSYVSIQGAVRSIQISSGATSSPDDSRYGLTVRNSGIGFSYFDGIDVIDTPILVTGLNDGKTGTINNIGSIGINATFDASAPVLLADALHIDGMTFGSSAPFGVSACPPNQPCYIGNQAIFGKFVSHASQPVSITNSKFYRAGTYGVQLESANQPTVTNNLFACNGLGAPTTVSDCSGNGPVYSAVLLNDATADLAQAPHGTGKITGNHGYGNGLDAIAFSGAVTSAAMTWQNATNVTNVAGDPPTDPHWLGYLLTGDLNMANATLTIPDGSVVKTLGGTINLTNSRLDASGPNLKTFTSLRDLLGIPSCPSVFAPSCGPATLPGGEWGGINLSGGSQATINKANIFYAATGIRVAGGATSTGPGINYGLVVSNSNIGPTFSDGIAATGTPISVTNTLFQCVGSGCQPPAAGDHGISADFTGSAAVGDGLLLAGNTFHGSVNEAIKGVGLAGQKVDIENNSVDRAGTAGIQLLGADRPTIKQNTITNSGTGTPTYPAIYLNGATRADFTNAITGNVGSRNGLDAIAFHGGTTALTWQTVANRTSTGPLGYLLDGPLVVNGALTIQQNDYVPSLGSITVMGDALTATGAVLTSLKDYTVNIPTCGSIFDQKVSGACPAAMPGDWGGLTLDSHYSNNLSSSAEIRYATTGITMGQPGTSPISSPLKLDTTNIRNVSADGIATQSSLSITGGALTNIGSHGIAVDLTGVAAGARVSISGASISGTGSEGILARGLTGQVVRIDTTTVDRPRATGISLTAANHLTLTNNTITNTPSGYPAIYLNGFTGPFGAISGNRGAGNGLDALAFHGTVTDDLTWITARKTGVVRPLGYLLDGDLNLAGTLQVGAGDIVKSTGAFNIGHLRADDTSNAVQKVFTSLSDDSAGIAVCHPASVLLPGCTAAAPGDWGGINLASDGALVNGAIRYATTGLNVSSEAAKTFGSSSYGLLVSRSRIDATKLDAIDSLGTPASVTNSSVNGAIHGINVDFTGGPGTAALRLSGNRFSNTGAEAVVGQALGGHPLWITDNQVQNATTFGIRLVGADQLVLRNNNISGSGGGPGAGSARYPAIWLSGVTADFTRDVRGNVGSANGLDAIVADGTAVGNVNWITPSNGSSTHALGYLLDGGFIVDGGTLTVPTGGRVQVLGGAIKINGGAVKATGATFTSLKDGSAVTPIPCPSVFVLVCVPAPGDWGGLMITEDSSAHHGSGTITGGRIAYAATGISIDSGPIASGEAANFRLSVSGTEIAQASNDGINSTDTPISVNSSTISGAGAHGVIASFFSPANCAASPAPCSRLSVTNSTITGAGKDGIVANGLAEQPVTISHNTITSAATYGIRLVGANELSMDSNTVNLSGSPGSSVKYPAIYLNSVTADFGGPIGSNAGTGNGLSALVFHGTANNGLTWITPSPSGTLGYMLDGPLTVNGALNTSGVVKVLTGAIKVNGVLTSVDTAFTSMRDATTLPVCNTVFVPSGCPSTATAGDWGGINVDPVGTSTFTRSSIAYATSGLTISSGEIDITGATLTHNSGYALTTAGTGNATVTCTGIHDNGGGILANGVARTSIDNSDLYGNVTTAGKDFAGTGPSGASQVWWNGTGTSGAPDSTQYAGAVTVDKPLPQQAPSVKAPLLSRVQFSSDNTNSVTTTHFGKGTLTMTLTFDRTMNLGQPLSVNFSGPSDGVLHPVIGDWTQTDKVTWVGHAAIDSTNQAGVNTLSVGSGTSCMRDGNNVMTTETAPFDLDFSTATVADSTGATHIGASSATLNGIVNANGWSRPTSNPAAQTYAFVEAAAVGTALPDPATVIASVTNPSSLFGYAPIGHGSTPLAVSQAVTGLAPSTAYHYAVVAVDLNGITVGADQQFMTTGPATGFTITDPPASNVAGSGIAETVAATDGTRVVADYLGNVALSSTDAQAAFKVAAGDAPAPLPTTLTFAASDFGSRTLTVIFKTSGPQSLTALDGGGLTGSGGGVTVVAAGLDHLALSPNSSTVASNAGRAYTVDARDAYDNSLGDETSSTAFSIAPDGSCATATCSATIADSGASHHTVTGTFNGKTGTATLIVTARVPGVPTGVTATPSNSSANVAWTAPADDGGSPVSSYTVTASPGGAASTVNGTTFTTAVTGLTNGTSYTFTVVATNVAGAGSSSAASSAIIAGAPAAPTSVTAIPDNGQASVSWVAPADTGGSPITKYTVTSSPDGKTAATLDGTTLTATVTGLTNGTAYTFTVVATNATGDGLPSAASSAVTPRTVPGAPTAVSATPGNGSAVVTWTAPTDNGGSPITGYTVTSSPTGGTPVVSGTMATVPALANGTSYTFTVVATNAAGDSAPSAPSSAVTPRTTPGAPTAVSATAGDGSVAVTWTAPTDNGGSPITKYTVTSSPDNKTAVTPDGSTLTATVSGLTNGTAYTFTVVATNAAGDGSPSAASTSATPQTPAGVPSKLVFTTPPSGSTGGIAFGTQPVVAVEDSFGTVITADNTSTVTLSISAGTGNSAGALTCTSMSPSVTAGQATFAGCAIDKVGNGYTLHAVSSLGSVTAATSDPVTITLGPAAKLGVTTQPSNSTGGIAFGMQPVVAVEDAGGNLEIGDSTSTVTLSINSGTGDPAGALTCTAKSVMVSGGAAAFAGCAINKVSPGGNPYTLHAVSDLGSVAAANTGSVAITIGSAAALAFTIEPAGAVASTAFTTQPVVSVEDAGGNVVATDNSTVVTLTLTPLAGDPGATLTCNPPGNQQTAVNGDATFSGCAIDKPTTGYRLRANGAGFQTDSQAFTVS